ncbi:MAG: sulfite exporter TauE/SafE family protein [Acidimicrobiia bacterium]|nr:sulfite exporter TauE/SafE family protein [Acidimicrobiia bacterium]MYC57376.1 sulfite exporter TauE/SafE family protein [Acidimicrobiia bacterium]MYG94579.1 sulfite exporter TauE/SafE family protein [Acidimicrobiia bacterium]MYI31138.1 sulfite exporter TauE/SafE family protein [Acidimicrobiia bacterium]
MPANSIWRVVGVGVASGFLSGLFGVGGGILMVPCMVLLLGMDQRQATGTSLGAMVLISAAGLSGFIWNDSVAYAPGLLIFAGSAIGVIAGTWLLNRLPMSVLQAGFAVLLLLTAVRFLAAGAGGDGHSGITLWLALGYVVCGLATGLLSGTMGVGGGIIMIPVMILLFGFVPPAAKGTSLLVIFPTSILGTLRNRRSGNIHPKLSVLVGISGVASAFVGAVGANQLSTRLATGLFAVLLVVVAVQMMRQAKQSR